MTRRSRQAVSHGGRGQPTASEVGGACRIQVLAIARTQETVGGPNEAARSEFRRDGLPDGVKSP
jgi:hypothetical protein